MKCPSTTRTAGCGSSRGIVEERWHGVPHCVPVQRHVHRLTLLYCTFIILLRCTFIILLRCTIFILIVSETGPSPARLEVRPHTSPQMARLAYFRLSGAQGESDRITQRSAVQIRPPQPMNATAEMQWRSPF